MASFLAWADYAPGACLRPVCSFSCKMNSNVGNIMGPSLSMAAPTQACVSCMPSSSMHDAVHNTLTAHGTWLRPEQLYVEESGELMPCCIRNNSRNKK